MIELLNNNRRNIFEKLLLINLSLFLRDLDLSLENEEAVVEEVGHCEESRDKSPSGPWYETLS